jgi:hypothetical protein
LADRNFTAPVPPEFFRKLYQTTLPSALGETWLPSLDLQRQYWEVTRYQFRKLSESRALSGPKFVFAHLLVPHTPFVFRADGSYRPRPEARNRRGTDNYVDQLQYTNDSLLRVVKTLMSGPERSRPIVIIQADEGMFPLGYTGEDYRWDKANPFALEVKLNILNAYYWPNLERTGLYPTITPVNTFRLLFRNYFGADVKLLPDRIAAWENGDYPCRFHDVTEQVSPLREPMPANTR